MRNRRVGPFSDRSGVTSVYCLVVLMLGGCLPAATQDTSPDLPYSLSTLSNVDENLFALRLLANIYANWPDLRSNRQQVSKWFANARSLTSSMRGQIASRRLDADLDLAYQGTLAYLSATDAYLSALDVIDDQASTQNAMDIFSSVIKTYKDGADAQSTASKFMNNENASNAGTVVGLASGLAQYRQLSSQRQNTTKAAIADQERKLQDLWNTTNSTLQGVARSLTAKYAWAQGEAGFDGFQSPNVADLSARYPRDPFIKAQQADAVASKPDPAQYQQAAYLYLQATQLVPADIGYDTYRRNFLSQALDYASEAAAIQAGVNGYSASPSAASYALKIARTYLSMYPRDANGWGNVELARALAFSGRYEEAVQAASAAYAANKQWSSDPNFCARYAALLSLTNRQNQVGSWLAQAFQDGYPNVSYLRQSPDFARFRYTQAAQFTSLTAVRWRWTIIYGVFNDDIVIRNDSAFPLTNVVVNTEIRQGNQVMTPQIKCESIPPGSSCKATDIVTIHNDRYDDGAAVLTSDQGAGTAQRESTAR